MSVLATFFSLDFVQRALLVGSLISLCAALLGVPLVLKRYSMIGDGLSHVGFAALAVAAALNATDAALYISIPVVVLAAFLLLRINESSRIKGDAAIGVDVYKRQSFISSRKNAALFREEMKERRSGSATGKCSSNPSEATVRELSLIHI